MAVHYLEFERPIADIETKIEELSKLSETAGTGNFDAEIEALRARAQEMRREAYAHLDAWQKVIKSYPTTTHAHTVEYRLSSKDQVNALFTSVETAFRTNKNTVYQVAADAN